MCEWLKQAVLKTAVPERVPGVRIPLPPPFSRHSFAKKGSGFRLRASPSRRALPHATGDPLSESSLTGTSQEEYIFFGGLRVARRDVTGSVVHYYFSDHLGSHAVVENATGSSCEQDIDYYPYGGVVHDYCGTVTQHYRFTGTERDTESSLDNFGARYYASSLGRFMIPDPAGDFVADASSPQSWNLYAYVLNNPLANTDPTGLECVWDDGSFDSADDPDTESAGGCGSAGGTYVVPDLFENAMLTNGQWNSNYGDWSSSSNANLAQNWTVPSGGVNTEAVDNGGILTGIVNWFSTAKFLGVGGSLWLAHPRVPVGWSPGVNVVSDGTKLHSCISVAAGGVGAKAPGGSVGPLFGDPSKAAAIIQGASVTVTASLPIPMIGNLGVQIITSSKGTLAGPTVGTPGASLQVGYSWPCSR
jgi:RHS repeat-associated protein